MLSHEYKCIFVHVPKVAGQSIEHVFLDLHGLTWKNREQLLLRPNNNPSAGPKRLAHLKSSEYVSCGHVTKDQFKSYYKFSFVRNPWSRLVSIYNYLGYFSSMSFAQFLSRDFTGEDEWEQRLLMTPQYDFIYNEKAEQLVDYVGRFEKLQTGFDHVCENIGIPRKTLPFVNKSDRGNNMYKYIKKAAKCISPFHKDYTVSGRYTEYYDNKSKNIVSKLYEKDIDYFKYTFDSNE